MHYEKWDAPFSDVDGLGRNYLLRRGDLLVIEVFEYKKSGPPEDIQIGDAVLEGSWPVGLTKESRAWRITFDDPLAIRTRHESQYLTHPERESFPSPYCFSKDSEFVQEIKAVPLIDEKKELIHVVMVLWDDLIEVVSEELPTIEEVKPTV